MKTNTTTATRSVGNATRPRKRAGAQGIALVLAGFFCLVGQCQGQGTMTIGFNGQPRGTQSIIPNYSESEFLFTPLPPESLVLSGGGIAGYPDNGTGYLEVPGGLSFFWDIPPGYGGLPSNFFNLLSFDAAEFGGPVTIEAIGFPGNLSPAVTNYFSVNSETFQTFDLDSSFVNLGLVEILNANGLALDNVVVGGVGIPEPTCGALVILAAICGLGRAWMRGRRAA